MRKILLSVAILSMAVSGVTQDSTEIQPLLDAIVATDRAQHRAINDIIFDAEYIEGEEKDGALIEKERFVKRIWIKFLQDTTLYAEEFIEYYKDGVLQDSSKLIEKSREKYEERQKRRGKDISWPIVRPFYPENRDQYRIDYRGLNNDAVDGYVCHHFRVTSLEKDPDLINGDFYFETETFHLARADFSPAKLVSKLMFKLKRLDMSIVYAPTDDGWWLPRRFHITGRGRAALLIGVKFAATELYRNPRINTGINDKIFEEYNEQQ